MAVKRIRRELRDIEKEPSDRLQVVMLDEEDIFTWHFVIYGFTQYPFAGGYYHGTITFPQNYPFSAPKIEIITPSGIPIRCCGCDSGIHILHSQWSPALTAKRVLLVLIDYMEGDHSNWTCASPQDPTTAQTRLLAFESFAFNLSDANFCSMFPMIADQMRHEIESRTLISPAEAMNEICQNLTASAVNMRKESNRTKSIILSNLPYVEQGAKFDDSDIQSLGLAVTQTRFSLLTTLNVNGNALTFRSVEWLAEIMYLNKSLTFVDIGNNPLGDDGIEMLSTAIGTLPLKTLNVNGIGATPQGLISVLFALTTQATVASLNLSDNSIGDNGMELLAGSLTQLEKLETLNINNVDLSEQGVQALEAILAYVKLKVL